MSQQQETAINDIAEKVFNGEYDTIDDMKMAFKLVLNAMGSDVAELRDKMLGLVEYSTLKKEYDGIEYIPVDTVNDIIINTKT